MGRMEVEDRSPEQYISPLVEVLSEECSEKGNMKKAQPTKGNALCNTI